MNATQGESCGDRGVLRKMGGCWRRDGRACGGIAMRLRDVARLFLAAVGLVVGSVHISHAYAERMFEGQPRGEFVAWFTSTPKIGQACRLAVSMVGNYDSTAIGHASIRLPIGISLVSGDTSYVNRVDLLRTGWWSMQVTIERPGTYR